MNLVRVALIHVRVMEGLTSIKALGGAAYLPILGSDWCSIRKISLDNFCPLPSMGFYSILQHEVLIRIAV
jgi:hypothetical protein